MAQTDTPAVCAFFRRIDYCTRHIHDDLIVFEDSATAKRIITSGLPNQERIQAKSSFSQPTWLGPARMAPPAGKWKEVLR